MKPVPLFLFALALTSPFVGGCNDGDDDDEMCTDTAAHYTAEMTRPLAVPEGSLGTVTVEACARTCLTGTSDVGGKVAFAESYLDGPFEGTIDRTTQTIRVQFKISETDGAPTNVFLRVNREGSPLLDEKATVEWKKDGCNLAPTKTSL